MFIFPFVLFSYLLIVTTLCIYVNMTFEMSLLFWNFWRCNVYCSFFVYLTFVYYIFHLLWQCKHMFPIPIKPLNWEVSVASPGRILTWITPPHTPVWGSQSIQSPFACCWPMTRRYVGWNTPLCVALAELVGKKDGFLSEKMAAVDVDMQTELEPQIIIDADMER